VYLDHLRKKRIRKETSAKEVITDGEVYDLLNQVPDARPVSNPEQQVLGRELGTHIAEALTKLTPRERIIIELKHYQGLAPCEP
jgi:RNA polymerase sigma-70 factor, ECF subfamily